MKKVLFYVAAAACMTGTVIFDSCKKEESTKMWVAWTLENGVLTIRGFGDMQDYGIEDGDAPWYFQRTSITSVVIESGITSIGDYAFFACNGLVSVTVPNSVTDIGNNAFEYCFGLTSVTVPNSVTDIGDEAFRGCRGLTSVTIPGSVTGIGKWAFFGCGSLTSFNVDEANSVYSSEGGVLFNRAKTTLVAYPGGKQGAYTVPNSVTVIGDDAFYRCDGLTSVTVPNAVTGIGDYAFADCGNLTEVHVSWTAPISAGDNPFANIPANARLYVPSGTKDAYEASDWSSWFGGGIVEELRGES
jgi:hypothetical protein